MGQISAILRDTTDNGLMFRCPGCDSPHLIHHGNGEGPRWGWNGDVNLPTFTPSVLVQFDQWVPPATTPEIVEKIASGEIVQVKKHHVCHSFVTGGKIQFLSDCTHALAGRTVDLPPWDSA